ncbi:hypothetical protein VaNZ11_000474, partial [Volvox africanus]
LCAQSAIEYLGPHGSKRVYANKLGIDICQYFWPAAPSTTPKGILVLAHGHGGYLQFDCLRSQGPGKPCVYEGSFVQQLNVAGYAVCGNDDRGAGRSGGLRGYCDSFNDYVSDLLDVARCCTSLGISSFEEGLPKFVCGLSKGGCVVLTAALEALDLFAGVICLAPMVSLEKVAKRGLNPYLRPLGKLLSRLAPQWPLFSTNRNTMYPDLQHAYDVDENCYHGNTRVRNAQEYLEATERLAANQAKLRLPLLFFHAKGDTMTDPEGTLRLYEAAESSDKTFISPPNMWHVLLKEPGHELVKKQILEWLDQRTVPRATSDKE